MHRTAFLRSLGLGSLGVASLALIDRPTRTAAASYSGALNVRNFGATGNGTTNDASAIQAAINALPGGQGALYFPTGTYLCTSDVQYTLNSRTGGSIALYGDGINSSTINFNGADFKDNTSVFGIWNKGWTRLIIKDMTLEFNGNGSTGKGTWQGQTTLPELLDVRLRTGGYYTHTSGMIVLNLGTASGPTGETCVWKHVMYEPNAEAGASTTFLAVHYDTFLWLGGGIVSGFAGGVTSPVLFNLRPVYTAVIDSMSDYVPSGTTNPALYAKVAVSDSQGQLIFRNCHIANYTAHFSTDSSTTPLIHLIDSSSEKWPLVLSKTQSAYSLPIMNYENNRAFVSENGGSCSIAHGGTVAHGLASTPMKYGVTATVAGHIATVTSVNATTLTIGLVNYNGSPVTSSERVAWWAEF